MSTIYQWRSISFLQGIAAFGVDAVAWGDRFSSFFRLLLDADQAKGTNVADRVFLILVVEHHIVDGAGLHCFDLGDPLYPRPGPASPHWYRPQNPTRNKLLTKHALRDVVDRALQIRLNDAQNQINGTNNTPPAYRDPTANVDKLDRLIRALQWEYE